MHCDVNLFFNEEKQDMTFRNDDLRKGENLLRVQLGSLSYLPNFGIDLDYFVNSAIVYQNETFKNYIVQRFAENNIVISEFAETVEKFLMHYSIGQRTENDRDDKNI